LRTGWLQPNAPLPETIGLRSCLASPGGAGGLEDLGDPAATPGGQRRAGARGPDDAGVAGHGLDDLRVRAVRGSSRVAERQGGGPVPLADGDQVRQRARTVTVPDWETVNSPLLTT
jgi:hypothetical protein